MNFNSYIREDLEEGVLESWLVAFEEALQICLPEDYRPRYRTIPSCGNTK